MAEKLLGDTEVLKHFCAQLLAGVQIIGYTIEG